MASRSPLVALAVLSAGALVAQDQTSYRKPPDPVARVLEAEDPPHVTLDPTGTTLLHAYRESMPSIATLARPILRIAGRRIDPDTRGPQRGRRTTGFALQPVEGGDVRRIAVPADADLDGPIWTADGQRFAFTNTTDDAIELWIADVATASAKKVEGVTLVATLGSPVRWMPDQRTLLCRLVPDPDAAPPERPRVPQGPIVQETSGKTAPVRTYQDLLENQHDARLFEFYATSQLARVDPDSGEVTRLGEPALVLDAEPSPDGKYVLQSLVHRPFSFLVPYRSFPCEIRITDVAGKTVRTLADLPLAEEVPIQGVRLGPRQVEWLPTEDATLVWVEALDGGDPRVEVPHRDRLFRLAAPFAGEPVACRDIEHRFSGLQVAESGELALLSDYDRERRWARVFVVDPRDLGAEPTLLLERSVQDAYGDPGRPLSRPNARGASVLRQDGSALFFAGSGATPAGDRPFLDRWDLASGAKQRLFRCGEGVHEEVVGLAGDAGGSLVIRHESPTEPPNWFRVDTESGERTALTAFTDETAAITAGITKRLVKYERADGVPLSATLYLPPGYAEGEKLPVLVWAYPREYVDPSTAGQVRASPYRYTRLSGASHLFALLCGYAVFDGAALPVIGAPDEANDTFVQQLRDGAQAAIAELVELGIADADKIAVGGHSYGAFMTANLLAHTDLFRAGIARSGAYNRTLTPFGFQNERRTFWEARDVYIEMSPFTHAHRIDEPILLIHGAADNNSGTFPVQSERLYHAIKGNGGTARLVMLPHESHGYAARESVLHALAEMIDWLDRHVKAAGKRAVEASGDR